MAKHGKNKVGPSHVRYVNEDHRTRNKIRRITKNNGAEFLQQWKKAKGVK